MTTDNELLIRLIPARAGNTREMGKLSEMYSAHPRSRGEHWHKNALSV